MTDIRALEDEVLATASKVLRDVAEAKEAGAMPPELADALSEVAAVLATDTTLNRAARAAPQDTKEPTK